MLVHIERRNAARVIGRGIDLRPAAALHAQRQIVIALKAVDRVHQARGGHGDQRGGAVLELQVAPHVGGHDAIALPALGIDDRIGRRGEHIHGGPLVPADVQPFAEMRAIHDRQLKKPQLRHRRLVHLQVVVVLRTHIEAGQRKGDVIVRFLHVDHRLDRNDLKIDDQRVPLAADAVGLAGRALVGMRELDLVVEGALLRHGKQRDLLALPKTLRIRLPDDQAPDDRVLADGQPERFVFQNDGSAVHGHLPFAAI